MHRSSVDVLTHASAALYAAFKWHAAAAPATVLLPAFKLCFDARPKAPPVLVAAAGCGGYWGGSQLGARLGGRGLDLLTRSGLAGLGGMVGAVGAQVAVNEVLARRSVHVHARRARRLETERTEQWWREATWELALPASRR